jgi:enoyl-CoA hydratase/carnithine racemase
MTCAWSSSGAGEAFSAGLDRRLIAGEPVGDDAAITDLFAASREEFDHAVATFQEGFRWLRDPRFISIAAVQGYAIGAGFQLALACDIRIATDDAQFNMREPALGIVPDLTGTKHLLEAVGYARALEWTTSARFVEAEEALARRRWRAAWSPGWCPGAGWTRRSLRWSRG